MEHRIRSQFSQAIQVSSALHCGMSPGRVQFMNGPKVKHSPQICFLSRSGISQPTLGGTDALGGEEGGRGRAGEGEAEGGDLRSSLASTLSIGAKQLASLILCRRLASLRLPART